MSINKEVTKEGTQSNPIKLGYTLICKSAQKPPITWVATLNGNRITLGQKTSGFTVTVTNALITIAVEKNEPGSDSKKLIMTPYIDGYGCNNNVISVFQKAGEEKKCSFALTIKPTSFTCSGGTLTVNYVKKGNTDGGGGGGGGSSTINLKINNQSGKTMYTNGWGKVYTTQVNDSHISTYLTLPSGVAGTAATSYDTACNGIAIPPGETTFNNVQLSGKWLKNALGSTFEKYGTNNTPITAEGQAINISFWMASKYTEDGVFKANTYSDPSLGNATITGGIKLEAGKTYTLTITNLNYSQNCEYNEQHVLRCWEPIQNTIKC